MTKLVSCRVPAALLIGALALAFVVPFSGQPARNSTAVTTVGALGSPEMIDFAGNETFSVRSLRKGLAASADFLPAAHPASPRPAFLQMIQAALERGYRQAGFADAKASVEFDAARKRVVATIIEGPRITCGEISVLGAQDVPAQVIVAALSSATAANSADSLAGAVEKVLQFQRPPKDQAANAQTQNDPGAAKLLEVQSSSDQSVLWETGKPTRIDTKFTGEISTFIRTLLATHSHPLARVTSAIEVDAARRSARLVVRIDEGPRARIGSIVVKGNTRNSNEEILQATGLVVGAEATVAALSAAKVALWNSARFYAFDVQATPRGPDRPEVDLMIEVFESKTAPLLREPLPRLESALVRLANWITTEGSRRGLSAELLKEKHVAAIALSPAGLAMDLAKDANNRVGLVFGQNGHRILIQNSGRNATRSFSPFASVAAGTLWFLTQADRDGSGRNKWISMAASMKTRESPDTPLLGLSLIVAPALACDELAKDLVPEFKDGVVAVLDQEEGWKLSWKEETGELVELSADSPSRGITFRVRSGGGVFERIETDVNAIAATLPEEAQRALVLPELFAHPFVSTLLESSSGGLRQWIPRAVTAGKLVELALSTPQVAAWFQSDDTEKDPGFVVPAAPGQAAGAGMIASLLAPLYYQVAVMLWPADTWPAKLGREYFYTLTGNTSHSAAVTDELLRDPRMGPIGNVIAGRLFRDHNPVLAWKFARRALDRGSAENFREDWRLLLNHEFQAGELLQNLVRMTGELNGSEITELLRGLPEKEIALARRVHDTLRENRDQPLATLLQPHLDEWWNTHMRPNLEARIGEMMAGDHATDPVIEAFTVNGLPMSRKFLNLATRDPQRFAFLPAPNRTATPTAIVRAREMLLQLALLDLELRNKGQAVLDSVINQKMAAELREQYGGDAKKLAASLTKDNLTDADYREIIRLRCIAEITRSQIAANVAAPTKDEVARALANPLPPVPETRHVRMIAFSPAPQAGAEAAKLGAAIARDQNFDQVWTRYSTNARTGARASEFRDIKPADLKPAMVEAVFSLTPGVVSPVVEVEGWHHLISVVAVDKRDSPQDLEVRALAVASGKKIDAAVLAHLARLRRTAILRSMPSRSITVDNTTLPKDGLRIEVETLPVKRSEKMRVVPQSLERFGGGKRWSAGKQALCTAAMGGWVEWEITVPADGAYVLELFGTRAINFCQVQPSIDEKDLGPALEFFGPTVHATGARRLGRMNLKAGTHTFRCTVVGKHPSSTNFQFGIDALDLIPAPPEL